MPLLSPASARHAWHYPRVAAAEPTAAAPAEPSETPSDNQDLQPDGPENHTPQRGSPTRSPDQEGFHTPDAAFPWWPVASHDLPGSESALQPAYHSSVQLASGRVGLLVDPDSYGNLVGEEWLSSAAARMQREPRIVQRESPLQVGGVGRGAQQCRVNCQLPNTSGRLHCCRLLYIAGSQSVRLSCITRPPDTSGEQGDLGLQAKAPLLPC